MASTRPPDPDDVVAVGEIDVEEVSCEDDTQATIEGRAEPVREATALSPEESAELDRLLSESEASIGPERAAAPAGLGPLGGGLGGSEKPARRAMNIGIRNGLTITSLKRSSGSTTSDHHVSQRRSSAVDMSNGSSPTPAMDRTARQIATLLGHPEFRGGNLVKSLHGYRVQLLYRTNIGGNHFYHVHVGVRAL